MLNKSLNLAPWKFDKDSQESNYWKEIQFPQIPQFWYLFLKHIRRVFLSIHYTRVFPGSSLKDWTWLGHFTRRHRWSRQWWLMMIWPPEAMVYFEYYHKEPQIAGELCQILEASGQVVPDDLRRIAREVEEGLAHWKGNKWGGEWLKVGWVVVVVAIDFIYSLRSFSEHGFFSMILSESHMNRCPSEVFFFYGTFFIHRFLWGFCRSVRKTPCLPIQAEMEELG